MIGADNIQFAKDLMSPELIKEIMKSYVYGFDVKSIADTYGLTIEEAEHIINEFDKDEVAKEYEYRIMLEGGAKE
jgi:hypothetical protein